MKAKLLLGLISMGLIISSCATYNAHNVNASAKEIKHIDKNTTNVFLIGDVGKPEDDGSAPKTLLKLQNQK